jgi:hypothetical protein
MHAFSDLPKDAQKQANAARLRVVQGFSGAPHELERWCRVLDRDAFLIEAIRDTLAEFAKAGGFKSPEVIGVTIGTMMGYGVDPDRAMCAVQFVLHGAQGVANP